MASEIDVCNLALARLGDDATVSSIDPPEGSAQAYHCARFYPLARDTMLDMHPWSFATTRASLALLDQTPPTGWTYAYARSSNAVKLISVLEAGAADDSNPQDFDVELDSTGERVIYSNTVDAVLRYTLRPTDPTTFPPQFVDTLATLLASYLAGPILKGDTGAGQARNMLQIWRMQMASAIASDANQRQVVPTHTPGWLSGR